MVVGAGISGLLAAHFYRKENPNARILILDNHDDFGGHAKRNEFQIGDRTLITHGGSATLVEPSWYSDVVKGLLKDLGVEPMRFESAYDQDFYKRNKLKGGLHFVKATWGVNRTVPLPLNLFDDYLPLAESSVTTTSDSLSYSSSNSYVPALPSLLSICCCATGRTSNY